MRCDDALYCSAVIFFCDQPCLHARGGFASGRWCTPSSDEWLAGGGCLLRVLCALPRLLTLTSALRCVCVPARACGLLLLPLPPPPMLLLLLLLLLLLCCFHACCCCCCRVFTPEHGYINGRAPSRRRCSTRRTGSCTSTASAATSWRRNSGELLLLLLLLLTSPALTSCLRSAVSNVPLATSAARSNNSNNETAPATKLHGFRNVVSLAGPQRRGWSVPADHYFLITMMTPFFSRTVARRTHAAFNRPRRGVVLGFTAAVARR